MDGEKNKSIFIAHLRKTLAPECLSMPSGSDKGGSSAVRQCSAAHWSEAKRGALHCGARVVGGGGRGVRCPVAFANTIIIQPGQGGRGGAGRRACVRRPQCAQRLAAPGHGLAVRGGAWPRLAGPSRTWRRLGEPALPAHSQAEPL